MPVRPAAAIGSVAVAPQVTLTIDVVARPVMWMFLAVLVTFLATRIVPAGAALNVCAALFGVGLSLAFDEFAMWLHLDDVYWSPEGRRSIDAIFCVLMITGILIGGADFVTGQVGTEAWWSSIVVGRPDLPGANPAAAGPRIT